MTSEKAAFQPKRIDSKDYRHTFYGILNGQGEFWTPIPFNSDSAAAVYLERFARGDNKVMLTTHKIVPVRIRLETLPEPKS
jgi:hypothetical protein